MGGLQFDKPKYYVTGVNYSKVERRNPRSVFFTIAISPLVRDNFQIRNSFKLNLDLNDILEIVDLDNDAKEIIEMLKKAPSNNTLENWRDYEKFVFKPMKYISPLLFHRHIRISF